jgi:glycosyltransferase involved in cell wall biosynthesis
MDMREQGVLSVATLMAVYRSDDPEHFHQALLSVLRQQLPAGVQSRIYLGVDGPLPEALEAVIARHIGQLWRVLRSPVNQGLAATLNGLFATLQDEAFVLRMDADDISHPERYATQLKYLQEHPEVDILGTDIVEFNTQGGRRTVAFAQDPEQALRKLHMRVPVAHPSVCMRRQVLAQAGGYPTTGTNEDVSLWFRCAALGLRFDNIHQPLLEFRITEQFWRRRSVGKAFSEWACYARGIRSLHGALNWRQLFPVLRLALRLAPRQLSQWAYGRRG